MQHLFLRGIAAVMSVFLLVFCLSGCGAPPPAQPVEETEVQPAKQVVVYYANWNLDTKPAMDGGEVASIPWDAVTYINHAFWGIVPADGTTETSFARRDAGQPARTQFAIASTNPEMDYGDTASSAVVQGVARNHFAQYEHFSKQYPNVNIMISVGGWTKCGYFSEMAYTAEGRTSFVQSCLALMKQYPWIDGIDIDWEYPAGSKDGERKPEDEIDEGCPIWGTPQEDNANFALLLAELRTALDAEYGAGNKKMTACASGSYGWTLPCQDWPKFEPYLDLINIMTYDFAGLWAGVTGHSSSLTDAKGAIASFKSRSVPMEKLCIGTPLYAMDLKMKTYNPNMVVGSIIEKQRATPNGVSQTQLQKFRSEAVSGYTITEQNGVYAYGEEFSKGEFGWHMKYDQSKHAPYLFNNDESSEYYLWFLSYEDELSLQAKLQAIQEYGLAGVIVWECSNDTSDHQYIRQMARQLS